MQPTIFPALRTHVSDGKAEARVESCSTDQLPNHEVLVEVSYSAVNYKDALALAGNRGITSSYPATGGIDAAGVIRQVAHDSRGAEDLKVGEAVIVHAYDLGMNTWGGFSRYIRVPPDWIVRMPKGMQAADAMAYGTAGFTAAQCIAQIEARLGSLVGMRVAVTGATGGVGSAAVGMLAARGALPVAITGKAAEVDRLSRYGAVEVVDRDDFAARAVKPMARSEFAAAVDTVGGPPLVAALVSLSYGGVVAACGNAHDATFHASVYPFILRAVALVGIDSAQVPIGERQRVWDQIGTSRITTVEADAHVVPLERVPAVAADMRAGTHVGRTVVKIPKTLD